jgi:hypothetical protein
MQKFLFAVLLMLGIVAGFSIGYRGFTFWVPLFVGMITFQMLGGQYPLDLNHNLIIRQKSLTPGKSRYKILSAKPARADLDRGGLLM